MTGTVFCVAMSLEKVVTCLTAVISVQADETLKSCLVPKSALKFCQTRVINELPSEDHLCSLLCFLKMCTINGKMTSLSALIGGTSNLHVNLLTKVTELQ